MIALLTAALAGTLSSSRDKRRQPTESRRDAKAPDCQKLLLTSGGPGVSQLCQAQDAMQRAEGAVGEPRRAAETAGQCGRRVRARGRSRCAIWS